MQTLSATLFYKIFCHLHTQFTKHWMDALAD